jgi:hypothetical protein
MEPDGEHFEIVGDDDAHVRADTGALALGGHTLLDRFPSLAITALSRPKIIPLWG